MAVAIMQPYFFPYIGYLQLMRVVDEFVFFDDVQYIERGWVNRNRIRTHNGPAWLTCPVHNDSRSLPIHRRRYVLGEAVIEGLKRQLQAAYARSKAFHSIYPLICRWLDFKDPSVSAFNGNLLTGLAGELGITCRFRFSSQIEQPEGLKGQEKIIGICRQLGATVYVNAIGGMSLYDRERFSQEGLDLRFLRTTAPPDMDGDPPGYLSIIDALMREGLEGVRGRLDQYVLLAPGEEGCTP